MRFLVDMPLSPSLCERLSQAGHDAVHAFYLGLAQAPDDTLLQYARDQERVVITADLDYPRLLALAQSSGPGVILFRGGDYSEHEAWERLQQTLSSIPLDELPYSVVVIEKTRLRRRRLPI